MIGKVVCFAGFLLLCCLREIECQMVTVDNLESVLNGSLPCNFSLKYEKVIDPKKLNLTWYNPHNLNGTNYSFDDASDKLIQDRVFWRYPSLNIYVSGYGSSSKSADSDMFKNAFLSVQKPILLIDYSAYCGINDPGYIEACYNIYKVGEVIAKFLNDMVKAGMETKDIHLMGASLGGPLVGYIARAFQGNYGQNVGRVTGLDPAGPCFDRASLDENLKKEDADFVDIYNFNRGQLGTVQILGHVNFLINGGGPKQKSCERLQFLNLIASTYNIVCAHSITTIAFWNTSIKDIWANLKGIKCDNLDQAVRQDCDGDKVNAGLRISLSTRGIFYVYFDYSVALTFTELALTQVLSIAA